MYQQIDMATSIPLNRLLLDRSMCEWVKAHADPHAKTLRMKRLPPAQDTAVGGLKDERLRSLETLVETEPIRVAPFRDSGHYEVLDGRHRTVLAISRGETSIVAVVEGEDA